MQIYGEITKIEYTPFLCDNLKEYDINKLDEALSQSGSFILKIDEKNKIAVSRWVSPKRTRSYPYARVYDTLSFMGKKITIIPVIKDEGNDGDRDFLQWDTISLMSLFGIYVIIAYYVEAVKNPKYQNKITVQKFDTNYIKDKINELRSYQSDALHWNLEQIDKIYQIAKLALDSYNRISQKLNVKMHSMEDAQKRIENLYKEKEKFKELSRELANKAQRRESITIQPNESLSGTKAMMTIKNYIGGYYYFTCDEVEIHDNELYLIEGKHGKSRYPSVNDVKDGLLKMILYTNLEKICYKNKEYKASPVLKLTTEGETDILPDYYEKLLKEAQENKFKIIKKKV
ncbi:hypothetical protein IM41_03165 [Fervidobacterium sp. SC_NGM5_G05]|nr:hypothetical protein IM41_03165 [Fervidobacterium sp. SC_NGM5_G05]